MSNDLEIERAQKEYEHVVAELARYHSDSQKLVSLVSLTLTLSFAVGVAQRIESIFPLIPILSLTLVQYLLANNYDYRVREHYVHRLEKILKGQSSSVPALYHVQLRRYFLDLPWWEIVMLPFAAAIGYTGLLLVAVSAFSSVRTYRYLLSRPRWMLTTYIVVCVFLISHTLVTGLWSWWKLRQDHVELR